MLQLLIAGVYRRRISLRPMDYSRPFIPKHEDKIDVDDLTTFLVTYMKNDALASIGPVGVLTMLLKLQGGVTHRGDMLQLLDDSVLDAADYIETVWGVTHREDMLQLLETHAVERGSSEAAKR